MAQRGRTFFPLATLIFISGQNYLQCLKIYIFLVCCLLSVDALGSGNLVQTSQKE